MRKPPFLFVFDESLHLLLYPIRGSKNKGFKGFFSSFELILGEFADTQFFPVGIKFLHTLVS